MWQSGNDTRHPELRADMLESEDAFIRTCVDEEGQKINFCVKLSLIS